MRIGLFVLAGVLTVLFAEAADGRSTVVTEQRPVRVTSGGLVDFGRAAFGWLTLEVPESAAHGDYVIRLGEKLTADGHVDHRPGGTIRAVEVKGSFAGAGSFRVPLKADERNTTGVNGRAKAVKLRPELGVVMPFRYAEVVAAPFAAGVSNITRSAVHWPMDLSVASFASSSPELDRVFDFCRYSIWATSFAGLYVDGDRERIPYEADAYLNQLGHYALEADFEMARRTFDHLMAHPTWPTEWRQHMIMMAWADWMYSGSTDLIARHYIALRDEKLMLELAREDGLLVTGGEFKAGAVRADLGDIVDWPVGERDGFVFRPVNAVVNAFHYRNLREMSEIAAALGKAEDASRFAARAERVRTAFDRVFYRPSAGVYADGEGTDHASLHVNAAALAFGLVPAGRKDAVADFLERKGMACSVYFAQYLLEALFEAGRDEAAIRLMTASGDRSWLGMMEQGSTITMEAWSLKAKGNQDWNHAWGTPPLNIISRYVLGVRPLKPGFAEYEVKPRRGSLAFVAGVVPTVRGPIRVDTRSRSSDL